MPMPRSGNLSASGPVNGRFWTKRRYATTSRTAPRNERSPIACVPLPQIAIAIPPPTAEPTRPIATVSQAGIGSGPGTASLASPPVMKPKIMMRMIEPSTAEILGGRRSRSPGRSHQFAAELLDLVAKLGGVLEPELLRRREHLFLELDDELLQVTGRQAFEILAAAAALRAGNGGRFERQELGAVGHSLDDRFRRHPVLLVVSQLHGAAAVRLAQSTFDRFRPLVGVHQHLPVDVAGRAADGLDQRRLAAQETLLVGIENRNQ